MNSVDSMQLLGAFSFPRLSLKRPEKSSRHPVRFGSPEGAKVEVPNFAADCRGGGGALAGCLDLSVGGILFLGKLNINFLLLTFIVSGAWASVRKGQAFPWLASVSRAYRLQRGNLATGKGYASVTNGRLNNRKLPVWGNRAARR